ncbi:MULTISPECIES: hypothetical protein [Deinococcus]|jgi:hypothetical protein|uniref:Uncharacterized protein n=5 Tax=Deinococcus TaxID=1298 RepID=A0ACC6KES7_9DEIO|nr:MULTISPECIES: hypothetical protein [Deinococcus]MDK2012020.1 hypothetical protein [Deinococcus sp. 43]MDR6217884.1 hypothetical protein [Deinococcus soli (ex Cha et al. 2016)]MDR6328134.1 hypothetical protein [Deinococcus soli (ex Cha et al. 2016)]MDR6750986.1 hypothetical protein [Deinococcus soli (ex Cha et al. 2016)]MXV18692.1 hypothetical protein [Deinococcus xianganensis]
MTEAALLITAPLPASALSAADLQFLHADLPVDGPRFLEDEQWDADALALLEWDAELPLSPQDLLPLEWTRTP